ncbi:MAG: THxN family PEP-CTERM protein [Azoarcus sp.]|jgi:hypothetical protein|nr:THxN family PEP-CTERM protein [Azoarcus sp.]
MKKLHKLAAASAFAFAASASQAAVVENWAFSVDLNWVPSATVFNQNATLQRGETKVTDTVISWGSKAKFNYKGKTTTPDYKILDADAAYARSGLEISKSHVTGSVATNGGSIDANMFTHYNNAIAATFDDLRRTQMAVSVDLWIPGTGLYAETLTKKFDVYFKETPNNSGACAWGACEDDIFAIISKADFSSTFTYGGVDYTFNYFDTNSSLKLLSDGTCRQVGITTGSCYGFVTKENGVTDVNFSFSVTAVPEPETYAMLLAGLGIVGFVARRRRSVVRN